MIQGVLKNQEDRDREERKKQYSQLLSCHLVDVEIQPFGSLHDRATLTIKSNTGCHQKSVEVAECYGLIEVLLEHNFTILSTGKVRRERDSREDEDRVFTWFILGKTNA